MIVINTTFILELTYIMAQSDLIHFIFCLVELNFINLFIILELILI